MKRWWRVWWTSLGVACLVTPCLTPVLRWAVREGAGGVLLGTQAAGTLLLVVPWVRSIAGWHALKGRGYPPPPRPFRACHPAAVSALLVVALSAMGLVVVRTDWGITDPDTRWALGLIVAGMLLAAAVYPLWPALNDRVGWTARLAICVLGIGMIVLPQLPGPDLETGALDLSRLTPLGTYGYRLDLKPLRIWAPSNAESRSELVLKEDGQALQANQAHDRIREEGGPRFSHWRSAVLFSTSDHSDPRTNGRAYSLDVPRSLLCSVLPRMALTPILGLALTLAGLVLAAMPWLPITFLPAAMRHAWFQSRTMPFLAATACAALIALVFWWNGVNVTLWQGRLLHLSLSVAILLGGFCYVFMMWRAERRYPFRTQLPVAGRLVNALSNLGMGLVCLGAAGEAAARAFPVATPLGLDPGIAFFWPEWCAAHNSLDYCDREPGVKRGPRVLIIGDSYAEGAGVTREERFSRGLERLWQAKDPTIEVFNAGRCGMDTLDEAKMLERTGDAIQPDVVVVAYVLNDAEGEAPASKAPLPLLDNLFIVKLRSYAYYRLYMTKHEFTFAHAAASWDVIRAQHAADSPGWKRVLEGMDRIEAWCEARNVRKILLVLPVFCDGADGARDVMDQVVAAAQARGFAARSALDDFDGQWHDLAFSYHDGHPGAKAHDIIARKLHEFVGAPERRYQKSYQPTAFLRR